MFFQEHNVNLILRLNATFFQNILLFIEKNGKKPKISSFFKICYFPYFFMRRQLW
jgi:hypothetical protein